MRRRFKGLVLTFEVIYFLASVSALLHSLKVKRARSMFGRLPVLPRALRVRASPQFIAARVRKLARFVPGATCLVQAVSLKLMLASRGIDTVVRIGVLQKPGGLAAHAWLDGLGGTIIGGEELRDQDYRHIADLDLSLA